MKKIILTLALVAGFGFMKVNAQSEGFEIGIRIANNDSQLINAIDGIYTLDQGNRIHGDADFGSNYVGLSGFYEWQFPLGEEGMTWYVGPGLGIAFVPNATPMFVQGNVGLEYHFLDIPLALGLEFRPSIGLIDRDGFWANYGIMARYTF